MLQQGLSMPQRFWPVERGPSTSVVQKKRYHTLLCIVIQVLTAAVCGCFAFAVIAAAVVNEADVEYDGLTIAIGCPKACRCIALYSNFCKN